MGRPETSRNINKNYGTFENGGYLIYIMADTCKRDLF